MAIHVLKDQKLWLAGFDLTGVMNALGLDYSADLQDATVFGDATHTRLGGLKDAAASHQGFFDGVDVDQALFDRIGLAGEIMSFGAEGGAEGNVGYTMKVALGEYAPGAADGDMLAFSVNAQSAGDLVRGTLMHNAARSASANGTARQMGAVASGQKLYGACHVLAAAGTAPTLDVTVESDNASGFASPVTRASFAQVTAKGAQWIAPVAGPITDDWWRVTWSLGGTAPAFTFVVILAIQ